MREFQTILVATDFSDCSRAAFDYGLGLARKLEARLLLVHVINEPLDLQGFYVPHVSFDRLAEEIEEGAKKMMDDFCKVKLSDFENYETRLVTGLPFEEIVKIASTENVDMVVLGTHGRSGLDHILFGSTAEKVVRKSPVPVLSIRTPEA